MKPASSNIHAPTGPRFIKQAQYVHQQMRHMDSSQLVDLMGVSEKIADTVKEQINGWMDQTVPSPAALTFRGDIYSGLAASGWTKDDAIFAQERLLIISGLYGLLKPFDGIKPYRLEMGYHLELNNNQTLDTFWESEIADTLDVHELYMNLTATEYYKVVAKRLEGSRVISPKFLTISEKTELPVFVTVHAKIARGSFASWLIRNKIDDPKQVIEYDQLNYEYDENLSSKVQPVFVCQKFGGLGLSVRQT